MKKKYLKKLNSLTLKNTKNGFSSAYNMKVYPEIIIIGGSAGSYTVIRKILTSLPELFRIPIVLCLHRLKESNNGFCSSLKAISRIEVLEPLDKQLIEEGFVYLAPSNYHLIIEENKSFALSIGAEENFSRPSIDITFDTASGVYKNRMIAILLSGANADGAMGIFNAFNKGAYSIIQDPEDSLFGIMPNEALKFFTPDQILSCEEIIKFINEL